MTITIGGERVTRLTVLRRNVRQLLEELKKASTLKESRVILTTHGRPVAVLQDYEAYQELLRLFEESQEELRIAKVRERLRLRAEGKLEMIPLEEVMERFNVSMPISGEEE